MLPQKVNTMPCAGFLISQPEASPIEPVLFYVCCSDDPTLEGRQREIRGSFKGFEHAEIVDGTIACEPDQKKDVRSQLKERAIERGAKQIFLKHKKKKLKSRLILKMTRSLATEILREIARPDKRQGAAKGEGRDNANQPSGAFNLLGVGLETIQGKVRLRPAQRRFRNGALDLYGPRCAVCDLACMEALDAAHLCPKSESGSDDPRNGIVLCASHHRLFDHGLFVIVPETLTVEFDASRVKSLQQIGITQLSLRHLPTAPHQQALQWRHGRWLELRR